jgi:hypothetical protein
MQVSTWESVEDWRGYEELEKDVSCNKVLPLQSIDIARKDTREREPRQPHGRQEPIPATRWQRQRSCSCPPTEFPTARTRGRHWLRDAHGLLHLHVTHNLTYS